MYNTNGDHSKLETPNKYVGYCKCGAVLSTSNFDKACRWIGKHQGPGHKAHVVDILHKDEK